MAKKGQWSRYRPPVEQRSETDQPVRDEARSAKPPKAPSKATTPAKANRTAQAAAISHQPWARRLFWLAVVAVVVGLVVAARAGGEEDSPTELETELVTTEFIGQTLDRAMAEEGRNAVSVRVDEFGVTVEYFDPNRRESRYFERKSYTAADGFQLRVEKTHYDDYQPRPFDLTVLDPGRMVQAVEDAIDRAEDPYTFDLTVSADRGTGEVTMVTRVGGEESIAVTQGP